MGWARTNKITSSAQWLKAFANKTMPEDFPQCPESLYSESWTCWQNFLGLLDYAQVKTIALDLNIKSCTQWGELFFAGRLPDGVPLTPSIMYTEWTRWEDFLSPLINQKSAA